jgi:hypothetical protein
MKISCVIILLAIIITTSAVSCSEQIPLSPDQFSIAITQRIPGQYPGLHYYHLYKQNNDLIVDTREYNFASNQELDSANPENQEISHIGTVSESKTQKFGKQQMINIINVMNNLNFLDLPQKIDCDPETDPDSGYTECTVNIKSKELSITKTVRFLNPFNFKYTDDNYMRILCIHYYIFHTIHPYRSENGLLLPWQEK